jgi:hypothetical protein
MLPNVDRYEIPFDDIMKKNGSARFVYEFDAADMATSCMYPAIARSFRTAGMQLATHFAYDPTFLAPYNTEYNTHYMNLFYSPQKALSLMICAEIFRNIPLYSNYGNYPDNTSFGPFHISYEDNLAEMVTDKKFIYTNTTNTKPSSPDKLELIAGWGNSPLIEYEGTGAYFLDKVGDGIWRLELMPDAIRVDNLFGRNSLDKTVAVIKSERRKMKINLPGFEDGLDIESIDWKDSILYRETLNKTIELKPGMYLLMNRKYENVDSVMLLSKKMLELKDFIEFPSTVDRTYIYFNPPRYWSEGKDIKLSATIVAKDKIDSIVVSYNNLQGTNPGSAKMKLKKGYQYEGTIPSKGFSAGELNYTIAAYAGQTKTGYSPGGDGKEATSIVMKYVPSSDPLPLFDAKLDYDRLNRQWLPDSKLVPPPAPGIISNLYLRLNGLVKKDDENPNATPIADYTMRHYFGDIIEGRKNDILQKKTLKLDANTIGNTSFPVQVSLVMKDVQLLARRSWSIQLIRVIL